MHLHSPKAPNASKAMAMAVTAVLNCETFLGGGAAIILWIYVDPGAPTGAKVLEYSCAAPAPRSPLAPAQNANLKSFPPSVIKDFPRTCQNLWPNFSTDSLNFWFCEKYPSCLWVCQILF